MERKRERGVNKYDGGGKKEKNFFFKGIKKVKG